MREKLILVLPTRSTFMRMDFDLLAEEFAVTAVNLEQDRSRIAYLKGIFRALKVIRKSRDCRRILVWFADYHAAPVALLSRFLKKSCYVFIGGYDAVCYPELSYGVYFSRFRGSCARLALKNCACIIANHVALLSSLNTYYEPQGHTDGVYKMIPGLGTPGIVIHNAIAAAPPSDLTSQRDRQVLTVGSTPRLQDFYNKGFDLLAAVAKRRPDLKFVFAGIRDSWRAELNRLFQLDNLENVTVLPGLPHAEMLDLMRRSAVYAQPSISEGMPNALMEAMLMGCVPVGSNVAGIPTVIGEHGFVIAKRDDQLLESALDQALAAEPDRRAISDSIADRFNREIRQEKLLRLLLA